MNVINQVWRTLSLQDKRIKGINLVLIFLIAGFIGAYSAILPTLLAGSSNDQSSLNQSSGSNLGYEEIIKLNIDPYGNLTVLGSFQGPQVTPNVNWALLEYESVWGLMLDVVNPNTKDYYYKIYQNFVPTISRNDVYLSFFFLTDAKSMMAQGMANPVVLTKTEMAPAALALKTDIEKAFGIKNNFSGPIGENELKGMYQIISFGFNYSSRINYNYFTQFFADQSPSGLADSFSRSRINNTRSFLSWRFSNNFQYFEGAKSSIRSPNADYNSSFECNVYLQYPHFFASYPNGTYSLNLNTVLDPPFSGLAILNQSAYSISEINIVVENGNITSASSPPSHIARKAGLDHDWWLLLNATFYDEVVNGLRTVTNIQVNFSKPLVKIAFITPSPPPTSHQGNVDIHLKVETPLTSFWGPMMLAEIYDEATFHRELFDDLAYSYSSPVHPVQTIQLMDIGSTGDFIGTWPDTYRYANGIYYIYAYRAYKELSPLTPRSLYSGGGGGIIYSYQPVLLNNPNHIQLNITSPLSNGIVIKNVTITANASSPEPILNLEYALYNYSQYTFYYSWNPTPMAQGRLNWDSIGHNYKAIWNSLTVPSTYDYVLRIKVTDANNTFFKDVPITVNNTLYQENIPIYAPMGADSTYGYDLYIGTLQIPQITDPWEGGSTASGGPGQHMFYGYGVDFGMDFNSHLYSNILGVFISADNLITRDFLLDFIQPGLPESDCEVMIMTMGPIAQDINTILEKAKTAFNIPTLTYSATVELPMYGGFVAYIYLYGYNYSAITYPNFINKFHNSVPSGLANIYTAANMTQTGVKSTILFGWMNPKLNQIPSVYNYNIGQGAFITPIIQFPHYFSSAIGTQQTVSLHKLFPQLSQIQACAPSVASAILSGFGPNVYQSLLSFPAGVVATNANITAWYPRDPMMMNVTPFLGVPITGALNAISFTMLNSLATPYGLRIIDDLRFNLTGPFITNNLLSPSKGQSIELQNSNVTITSQSLTGTWYRNQYLFNTLDGRHSVSSGFLYFNGKNWTDTIQSLNIPPGYYSLITYIRDTPGNWALNTTLCYINNTYYRTMVDIYITDSGDVELTGYATLLLDYMTGGYGVHLGINPDIYNDTALQSVSGCISAPDTLNQMSIGATEQDWNVFFMLQSYNSPFPSTLGQAIKADIEHAFNITGLLQELTPTNSPMGDALLYGMNFNAIKNYEYFLDYFDQGVSGNISRIFSKENLLQADQSSMIFAIYPTWFINNMIAPYFGVPANLDFGENIFICPWMRFENVYDYNKLNQLHNFSLADLLNLTSLTTATESGMTYSSSTIYAHVGCGNFTEVYPNIGPYVTFTQQNPYGSPILPTYRFQLLRKQGNLLMGLNTTDDIRFNFTAPNTLINIISPQSGASAHYNISIIANATMLFPAYSDAKVSIYHAGVFNFGFGLFASSIDQFNITYNPLQHYWNGTWSTLNANVENGWYDLVFTFYDALGRPQRNITRILVHNTYYSEYMTVNVDQLGNVSVTCQFQGNALVQNWNLQLPEYKKVMVTALEVFNAYQGFHNTTKNQATGALCSPNDIIVSVLFMPNIPISVAAQWAIPIKEDWERVFGIEGLLTHLTTTYFQLPMGAGPTGFIEVIFGANYSASITYDHFIKIFHQQLPNGMNNTIPASTIKGTDSYLMWQNMAGMYAGGGSTPNPPNIKFAPVAQAAYLKYPQYFGNGYLTDSLSSHTLNISKLLKIPQIYHAPTSAADSLQSGIGSNMGTTGVSIQNGNIMAFYPNLPGFAGTSSFNQYYCLLAQRNPYNSYMGGYQYLTWEQPPLKEVNVTWTEPLYRIRNINPAPGSIVNGQTIVYILVQNNTIFDFHTTTVTLKIYTGEEVSMLTLYEGYGLGRPAGRYGQITLTYGGQVGNALNFTGTWLAYQHPNGPIWYETVVTGSSMYGSMIYTYNTTKVTISNSNPLAVTPISPTNGATVSDLISIAVQITNSTPIQSVQCTIKDGYELQTYETLTLLAQGGGIYSIKYGTQGLPNGVYLLTYSVRDIYGAIAYKEIQINVTNPKIFTLKILYPTSELDSASQAVLIANASGPYLTKYINYKIIQGYTMAGMWSTTGLTMSEGRMLDPNSLWVAYFDSSSWPSTIQPYGTYGPTYDASYQIELSGYDIRSGHALLYAQFPIGTPAVSSAEIIDPQPTLVAGLFYVWVNVTVSGDRFNYIKGDLRRSSDNQLMDSLKFTYLPNQTLAYAPVMSYCYSNQNYTLSVIGSTMSGTFSDSVQVAFYNTEFLTATLTSPTGTISGLAPSTAIITHPYPLDNVWVSIFTDPEGNNVGGDVNFYHDALQNPTIDNISSFASGYSDYTPSLIEVDSSGWSYYCAYAMAIIRNGGLYFGNSTDGITWDFSALGLGGWQQNPCLVQAFDGSLYILYDDGSSWQMRLIKSTDGGLSWSAPYTIWSIQNSYPTMIQLQNGDFMIACVNSEASLWILTNLSSDIMTCSWNFQPIYSCGSSEQLRYPSILQLADGSFKIALTFSPNYYAGLPFSIYLIDGSSDMMAWSSPYPITPYRSGGSEENKPSLIEAQDGGLILVYSGYDYGPYGRQILILNSTNHINWSRPSPVTWNQAESRFPCLIQCIDGHFMVAFGSQKFTVSEVFIATFDGLLGCTEWKGFIPSYTLPNRKYYIQLWAEDINDAQAESNRLYIITNNSAVFTVNVIKPFPGAVVSGIVTVQLEVQSPYPIEQVWADVWSQSGPGPSFQLNSFKYNTLSGYWEQSFASWAYSDGSWAVQGAARDSIGTNVWSNDRYFSISNPFTINCQVLNPLPGQPLWGTVPFIINATGQGIIKWVSWSTDRGDPMAEKYPIYQGLVGHTDPWLEYYEPGVWTTSIIELTNGSLLMAYELSGNIFVTMKQPAGWTDTVYIGSGNFPCLYQRKTDNAVFLAFCSNPWTIWFGYSPDNGTTWLSLGAGITEISSISNPSLAEMANGTLVVAYDIAENNYDIKVAFLDELGPSWTGIHTVLTGSGWQYNPSIIRTVTNEFVIAYTAELQVDRSWYMLIATALSTDNCLTFGNIATVTANCYHEWQWWSNPSLIQNPEGEYVIACETSNSPWSREFGGGVLFIFNSTDRINWGIAKPLRNDTYDLQNYDDEFPCLIYLQNGTYLVAHIEMEADDGIYFTTFQDLTEKGLWLLMVDTPHENAYRPFNLLIEDIWHVEQNFSARWNWWVGIPPSVIFISPLEGTQYQEYTPIPIVVNVTDDVVVDHVELWAYSTYIMNLIHISGNTWRADWSNTIGWVGITYLQIRAYDFAGNVNDTMWTWVNITRYIPPAHHADVYKVTTTNEMGYEQTIFSQGETINYQATIRGDVAGSTYIITAQTDDPLLQGYLSYNASVTVPVGQDISVIFHFSIGVSAPKGIYTAQIIVWTAWPWNGGYCVDFITITFEVV